MANLKITDAPETPPPSAASGGSKLLFEVGPIAIFMIVYNVANRGNREARDVCAAGRDALAPGGVLPAEIAAACAQGSSAIYTATGVFIVATLASLGYMWWRHKTVSPMLILTAALVTVFGGLTLWLQSPLFIYIKPTIVNLLFAGAILGSLVIGRNALKLVLGQAFVLPDAVWRTLALRFASFYVFLAILNEVVWRTMSEPFWANFKLLGVMPITFAFIMANMPLIMKHQDDKQDTPPQPP